MAEVVIRIRDEDLESGLVNIDVDTGDGLPDNVEDLTQAQQLAGVMLGFAQQITGSTDEAEDDDQPSLYVVE